MTEKNFLIVHPDPAVIPDDGGNFRQLDHELIIHRDPSASVNDLVAPTTVGILFAAQLDSELPLQVCQILAKAEPASEAHVFFWGPGCSGPLLSNLWQAGATDCFSETHSPEEVALRIRRTLQANPGATGAADPQEIAAHFNKTVRDLAHDLKNPLCILHGYAQMAQMGQEITPDEAKDMLESSREICDMIDRSLTKVDANFFSSSQEQQGERAS